MIQPYGYVAGLPSIVIDDSGDGTDRRAVLDTAPAPDSYQLTGLADATIVFGAALDPATPIRVHAGAGNDTFIAASPVAYTGISIDGGGGSNTLAGPNAANSWTINGGNAGSLGSVAFANVQNLVGGSAGDTFAFHTGGSISGTLDGGAGVNALDYSAYVGDITVDLALQSASQVNNAAANSVFNIANVTGSQGNDILVGDASANVLVGGTGRNLVIGGLGADQLFGGLQDNLLIGGTTSYDLKLIALQAIMKEWTSADSYATRIKALSNGVIDGAGNRDALVGGKGKAATVFDDAAADVLHCTPSTDPSVLDWLFASPTTDQIVNLNKKDTVSQIF